MEDGKKSTAIPVLETDELDHKVVEHFAGKIVRNDEARCQCANVRLGVSVGNVLCHRR